MQFSGGNRRAASVLKVFRALLTPGKPAFKKIRGDLFVLSTANKKSAVGLIQQRFSVGHFVPHVSSFSTSKIWVQQN